MVSLTKPKIAMIWPFTEKACQHLWGRGGGGVVGRLNMDGPGLEGASRLHSHSAGQTSATWTRDSKGGWEVISQCVPRKQGKDAELSSGPSLPQTPQAPGTPDSAFFPKPRISSCVPEFLYFMASN